MGTGVIRDYFNPRSREGSDDRDAMGVTITKRFQSTLPRRERHMSENGIVFYISISIHAPAKGATATAKGGTKTIGISIHAPAKGATLFCR